MYRTHATHKSLYIYTHIYAELWATLKFSSHSLVVRRMNVLVTQENCRASFTKPAKRNLTGARRHIGRARRHSIRYIVVANVYDSGAGWILHFAKKNSFLRQKFEYFGSFLIKYKLFLNF